jgi:hypothetical protein
MQFSLHGLRHNVHHERVACIPAPTSALAANSMADMNILMVYGAKLVQGG